MHCPSNSFSDLFCDANENGVNKMWLYCNDITDKNTTIGQFCSAAWSHGWLNLRLEDILWKDGNVIHLIHV